MSRELPRKKGAATTEAREQLVTDLLIKKKAPIYRGLSRETGALGSDARSMNVI